MRSIKCWHHLTFLNIPKTFQYTSPPQKNHVDNFWLLDFVGWRLVTDHDDQTLKIISSWFEMIVWLLYAWTILGTTGTWLPVSFCKNDSKVMMVLLKWLQCWRELCDQNDFSWWQASVGTWYFKSGVKQPTPIIHNIIVKLISGWVPHQHLLGWCSSHLYTESEGDWWMAPCEGFATRLLGSQTLGTTEGLGRTDARGAQGMASRWLGHL